MSEKIRFTLDGRAVEAAPGESLWQVAKREGTRIPHLCHLDAPAKAAVAELAASVRAVPQNPPARAHRRFICSRKKRRARLRRPC